MNTKYLISIVGFGLACALSLPGAFAQNTDKRVHSEPVECSGDDEVELDNVEIRTPVTVSGDCELELDNVVIRGEGTMLKVSNEGDVELEDVQIFGNVELSDDGELEAEDSKVQGDMTLTGESEASLDDSSVSGNVSVSEDAEYDD